MPLDGAAELARFRPAIASGGDVQAVDRSAVGGESARYRRVSPPERAVVLCVDEKSQVQALDRAQPLMPMRLGQAALTTTRGTTSLFAALDVKAGTIAGKCMPRHRASEFRKCPDEVERSVPKGFDVHIIMDNVATHKTKPIRDWLTKRSRWHVHFTPNTNWRLVDQSGRALLRRAHRTSLARGVFRSVAELEKAIKAYIAPTNVDPKPFPWTKTADHGNAVCAHIRAASVAAERPAGGARHRTALPDPPLRRLTCPTSAPVGQI